MDDVHTGFVPYVPFDRRVTLMQDDGDAVPAYATGAVLMADLAGFTHLTAAFARAYGSPRGAEEVTAVMDTVFAALIDAVHAYRGSVIGFAGDAITCWFADPTGQRALAAAQTMQRVMPELASVSVAEREYTLTLKIAIVLGSVRRWLVGDPDIQMLDVLAGQTLDRLAVAGAYAARGDIVCDPDVCAGTPVADWHNDPATGAWFAVLQRSPFPTLSPDPWPRLHLDASSQELFRPWLLPAVAVRLHHGQDAFLGSFRTAVALFLRFTGIAYDHDPDAGRHLDTFIRWTQQILESYAGSLIQLTTGDKGSYLYAAFGAPIAAADMTEHALAAAWTLRDAPQQFSFLQSVQIGISQGSCYTGAYGGTVRRTYGVLGDDVNRAARLMQHATSGQVLVSSSIAQVAAPGDRRWYTFRPLEPLRLTGASSPVPVAELMVRDGRHIPRVRSDPSHRLIGRQQECTRLLALLADARQSQGRLVVIEGEAGIGKTHLMAAFHRRAEHEETRYLIGTGESIQRHRAYGGWHAVFSACLGLEHLQSPAARQAQVQRVLADLAPHMDERLPLLNDILDDLHVPDTLLTAALEAEHRQRALIDLLATLLLRLTAQHPLLVVLEDAHWMDSLSWELIQHLGQRLSACALLLVVTTRPLPPDSPATAAFASLLQRTDAYLRMTALPAADTHALAAQQLGMPRASLPDTLTRWLFDRTGGHPLLVVETVRTLRADELIGVDEAGTVHFTGDLVTAALPTTVQELVQARLDRLPPNSQLVARVAAVIGSTVPVNALRAVLAPYRNLPMPILHAALAALEDVGMLTRDRSSSDTYQFSHTVVQETVYATLLWQQRRDLHRHVADWLLNATGESDPPYAVLVHHYHHAEEHAQECHYAALAGHAAAARFANTEALPYFNRALELLPDGAYVVQVDLLLARERLYDLAAQRELQARDLATLSNLAGLLRNRDRRAEVALREAHYWTVTSAFRDAIQAAQRALTLATPGSSLLARGFAIWGEALFLQGRYREADTQVTTALHRAQEAGDQATTARIVLLLARMAREQGDLPAAQEYYTAVQPLLARLADRPRMALACKDQGTVALDMYDYPRAEAHYQQALGLMREIGDRRGEGMVVSNLGLLRWKQGDMTTAAASYRYDLEICRSTGDQDGELSAYLNLGAVAMDAGAYRTAHAYMHTALNLSRALADQTGIVYAHDVLGLLAHYQGDLTTAAAHYAEARQGAQAQNDAIGVLRMDALQGLLAHHHGDHGTAVTLCRHALAQARTCEAVAEEAAAFLYLGHALAAQDQLAIAGDAYRAATSILQTGSPHRLAEAQAGTALVLLRQGQAGAALDVVEKLLAHLAHHPWLPGTDEPLRVWWVCWQVLQHHADPRASAVLERASRLLHERADQVLEGNRANFVALPLHRTIQTSWKAREGNSDADSSVWKATYHR